MVDLNDPLVWNIAISAVAGFTIAYGARIFAKYSGGWSYTTKNWPNSDLSLVQRISSQIKEPIEDLGIIKHEFNLDLHGHSIDEDAFMESKIYRKMKIPIDPAIFQEDIHMQRPNIDYVVLFSNSDTKNGNKTDAKVVAASIADALQRQHKRVQAYAIGTTLAKIEDAYPLAMLNIPTEHGFNLFNGLVEVHEQKFRNPTYMFVVTNGSAVVSDEKYEKNTQLRLTENNRIVYIFIELGRHYSPKIKRFAGSINAQYDNIRTSYGGIANALEDTLEDAVSRMREKCYD